MVRRVAYIVLILTLAQIATSFQFNDTLLEDHDINLIGIKTRRKEKSTSSDSGEAAAKDGDVSESLNVVFTDSSSEDSDGVKKTKRKKKDRAPKSTVERKGWRKWHRKCTKCPEDMQKKWRNPSISWICGAYQRARRSFKSLCMMYYRNCQDGTMFTKIADHRCPNGTREGVHPYNFHFFYDYSVVLTDESESTSETLSDSESESTDISNNELEKNLPKFYFDRPN